VLAAYEGVAKVEQLPVAIKHATLQTAINRAVRNFYARNIVSLF
jgi:hypothetical protein